MSVGTRRRGLLAGLAALGVLATSAAAPAGALPAADPPGVRTSDAFVAVGAEPDGTAVRLDTRLYLPAGPAGERHPAVLLAHGFGGSRADVDGQARTLASDGYVVLAWTARGFGASGGRIHLDDPDFEVRDAARLVDLLATRPEVLLDRPGDPRVGVVGGSYGGALALMLAATDARVDAVVPMITWHDLADALFPQSVVGSREPGPFKRLWASRFFASAVAGSRGAGAAGAGAAGAAGPGGGNPLCGRFDPTVCRLLLRAAETGQPSPALLALLRRNSPAPVLARTTAPTLLVQGMRDSLFGLDQADATARALAAAGTRFAVRWTDGGHDGRSTNEALDDAATLAWLGRYLHGSRTEALPVPAFTYALPLARRAEVARLATLPRYPGLASGPQKVALEGSRGGVVLNPPGGQPGSLTSLPGLASLAGLPTYRLAALPGSSTAFDTVPLPETLTVVGAPEVELDVTSTGTATELFVSLWQVQGGEASQQRALVAPLRAAVAPGRSTRLRVALPPAVYSLPQGSRWRVLVSTTDSAYAVPAAARADRVSLASPALLLPTARGTLVPLTDGGDGESLALAGAIAALLLGLGASALLRRRRSAREVVREDLADVPLVVDSLVKTYADGHRAVDDVSWRAEKGQVVGLLGPNGAGKTTTMRMLLGLITPDSGTVHVLGRPVHAGSPVLGRVGALVEGPGFLPHLTGRQNLHAYWRATGRPEAEAHVEDALAVAALGGALDRPVRTYSHGMKQRLGIAQAMLGRPEVLFLDEPTNGLDPPQIAAMRPILQTYAATGRTVVVSSHLLAEVEMTCSHVVVMHAGRVVTAGPVADLVASEDTTVLELPAGVDLDGAADLLRATPGVRSVEVVDEPHRRTLTVVAGLPRADVVRAAVDAGLPVEGVGSRRHLEEVFLGVIASARHDDDPSSASLVERLRQVRAR